MSQQADSILFEAKLEPELIKEVEGDLSLRRKTMLSSREHKVDHTAVGLACELILLEDVAGLHHRYSYGSGQ